MTTEPIIKLTDVNFAYHEEPVLDHISLEVGRGEYLGVVGPNGGGKTTLLRVMLGLARPSSGSVQLFGQPIADLRERWRVGYVPQRASGLDSKLPITVEEVVGLGRVAKVGLWHRFRPADRVAVADALEHVGMSAFRRRLITELSGGQRQRVFIAKALASDPEILILDEPTTGVDVQSQDDFYQLLATLNKTQCLTLVVVSHDIDVIMNEVTKLACINETLVYHGVPKDFLKGDYMEHLYGKTRKFILHGH
jgi:zinc transport system ATP-binding protein